jgi:mannose-6-phosphate isomerase-like protein (cupin superfamily)
MIFAAGDLKKTYTRNPRGGEGLMEGETAFFAENASEGSSFRLLARMTLLPGASIGKHCHVVDEEIYAIISGEGIYYDNDGVSVPVSAGCMTLTRKGESHGLVNTGAEPLVFFAVVAENPK